MTKQSLALSKIATSTWGATFAKLGTFILQWFDLQCLTVRRSGTRCLNITICQRWQLAKFQSFRINAWESCQVHIRLPRSKSWKLKHTSPPMSLYLKHLPIKARYRLRVSEQSKLMAKSCKKDSRQIEKIKEAAPAESRPRQDKENMSGQGGPFRATLLHPH